MGQIATTVTPSNSSSQSAGPDPKRPYGGLVPSQPKGTRAYQDAASYNQHLAHHQAYTAQAQASQATTFRNPYMAQQNAQQSTSSSYPGPQELSNSGYSSQSSQQHHGHTQYPASQAVTGPRGPNQSTTGQLAVNTSVSQYSSGGGVSASSHLHPNPPSNSYYPNARTRANTINQMDAVPPALARLQHMNQDVIAGRNALTPVLNRDDAMREWERRQSGKATTAQPYPQLEFLQQQAEMATASGLTGWPQPAMSNRYPPPPSKLAQSYHPQTIVVDDDSSSTSRRDAVMSNVRSAARSDPPANVYGSAAAVISNPPQVYSANAPSSSTRYATYTAQQQTQQQTPASSFDSIDRRTDMGSLFVPMQPDQYQQYTGPNTSSTSHPPTSRHVTQSSQAAPSFYGAGVVSTGQPSNSAQQRNPFTGSEASQQGQMSAKDSRRSNTMDVWPR
jgi:dual specificity protein kinase YAK1